MGVMENVYHFFFLKPKQGKRMGIGLKKKREINSFINKMIFEETEMLFTLYLTDLYLFFSEMEKRIFFKNPIPGCIY